MSSEDEYAEPPTDYFIDCILHTFLKAHRSRKYSAGMVAVPLPITIRDITDVLEAHPVPLSREVLDECIFAIDEVWISENMNTVSKES